MNRQKLLRVFSLCVVAAILFQNVTPARAWDSMISLGKSGENSHYYWAEDGFDEVAGGYASLQVDRNALLMGAEGEDMHPQKRDLSGALPAERYQIAVGNNGGSNYPEYYWQTAVYHYRQYVASGKMDALEKQAAYHYLGLLLHTIQDASSPPHTYSILHGKAYLTEPTYFDLNRQDTVEYLSAVLAAEVALGEWFTDYPYTWYQHPDSPLQPGKNVLDVGSHGDDEYVTHTLFESTGSWTGLFTTNLQAPGARKVKVYTIADTFDPTANPVFYLRFWYYNESGVWTNHETDAMCASIDRILNAPCLGKSRTHEWADSFAPNTDMVVEYKRTEGGTFVVDRDVAFKVYVEETESVADDLSDPHLSNPWEYAEWFQKWTMWYATYAPFWRRYWTTYGDYGDLKFNLEWFTAPNSERALLTMLAHANKEVVKWSLRSAFNQFKAIEADVTSITDAKAIGEYSYRVAIFADPNYNSTSTVGPGGGSPEYLRSLSFGCTPYEWGSCDETYISLAASHPWMNGIVSSITVRNATVELYNSAGTLLGSSITGDTASLGPHDNQVAALRIKPNYELLPLVTTPLITAGNSSTCRLKFDGSLACWGLNANQMSTTTAGSFAQIDAGMDHICGVRPKTYAPWCWGANTSGQASPPAGLYRQISAGSSYSCGRSINGQLVCWGDPAFGLTSPPAGTGYQDVSAGRYHACAVTSTNAVSCWGSTGPYEYPLPNQAGSFRKVSVGDHWACAIRTDNTISCWVAAGELGIYTPPSGTFTDLAVGGYHACAIRTDKTVACWGMNNYGQASPVGGLYTQIGAGDYHSCGLDVGGFVVCWGLNQSGQAPVLSITPTTLLRGRYRHPYTLTFKGSGGTGPYYFSTLGNLPPGMKLNSSGVLSGAPVDTGTWTMHLEVIDQNQFITGRDISITIDPNGAPVAAADAFSVAGGTSVLVNVLVNDRDPDADPLVLKTVSTPAHGAAVIQNNQVLYTPQAGFSGTDSITYTVDDRFGGITTATVSITVTQTTRNVYLPFVRR